MLKEWIDQWTITTTKNPKTNQSNQPQLISAWGGLVAYFRTGAEVWKVSFLKKTNPNLTASSSYKKHVTLGLWDYLSLLKNKTLLSSPVSYNSRVPCCLFEPLHFKVRETETQRVYQAASGLSQDHRRAWTRPQAGCSRFRLLCTPARWHSLYGATVSLFPRTQSKTSARSQCNCHGTLDLAL